MKRIGVWVLLGLSVHAWGWGNVGHRVVGKIAENHLSPKAKQGIKTILGFESLAEAATWGDEVRSDEKYKKYDNWHFVEIPDGMTYETAPKNPNGDVVLGIQTTVAVLKGQSTEFTKKEALRYLIHFVGDVHQPLHVGNGTDRGANWCTVKYAGRNNNLHAVWDSALIDAKNLSYTELSEFLDRPDLVTAARLASWARGTVVDWAHESMSHRNDIYPPSLTPAEVKTPNPSAQRSYCKTDPEQSIPTNLIPVLSYPYEYQMKSLLHEQLTKAGIRLSYILNDIYN
jgi:hypothetical protein